MVISSSGLMSLTRDRAGVERLAVEVAGAGLADIDAAPVLGPGDAEHVADDPEQAHRRRHVHGDRLAVEAESVLRHLNLLSTSGAAGRSDRARSAAVGSCETGQWVFSSHGVGVGAGGGRPGHRDSRFALAGRLLVRIGRQDVDLELVERHVPLPGVGVVVPAGLQEVTVHEVQAGRQRVRHAVEEPALDLRFHAQRVDDDLPGNGGVHRLDDPRAGDAPCEPCDSRSRGGSRAAPGRPSPACAPARRRRPGRHPAAGPSPRRS